MKSLSDNKTSSSQHNESIYIVYDGECPVCSTYVKYMRLKEQYANVVLINAREDCPLVEEVKSMGLCLDEGMVLKINDHFYHGHECIHMLSLMTTENGMFNKLNSWVFKSPARARILYPFLRSGRNTLLWILGKSKINVNEYDNADPRGGGSAFAVCLAALIAVSFFSSRFLGVGPAILGVFGMLGLIFIYKVRPFITFASVFWAISIPVLAMLSTLWAIDESAAFERSIKILCVCLPGVLLLSTAKTVFLKGATRSLVWIVYASCFLATMIMIESLFEMPFYNLMHGLGESVSGMYFMLNRSTVALAMVLLPTLFIVLKTRDLAMRKLLVALLLMPTSIVLFLSYSQSVQLAAVLAALFFFFFPYRHKYAWYALSAVIVIFINLSPWISMMLFESLLPYAESSSWLSHAAAPQRLEIWNFVSQKIMESPLYGFGAEATRSITFDTQKLYYPSDTVLHPHNFALQLWIEFGVIGALTASAFCVHMLYIIRTSFTSAQARYVLPVFMAALSIAATGYGIWQGWLLGLFMLTITVVFIAVRATDTEENC